MADTPSQTNPSQTGSTQTDPVQPAPAPPSSTSGTGSGGVAPEILSARTQATTANFIVGGLIFISLACIITAYLFVAEGKTASSQVAGGAITGLISIVSAAVGGLVNSLVAPSGVAAVVAAAQKDGQRNG